MAQEIRDPVLSNGPAAENLCPEIAEKIAKRHEHDRPCAIPKRTINIEDPQVQEQDGHLIPEQTGQVSARGDKDPLLILLSEIAREVPGVETHAVAGGDAEEDGVGDAEG